MTYEFEYLMYLLSYASVGREVKPPMREIDWSEIQELAIKQNVLSMLAYAVKKLDNEVVSEKKRKQIYDHGRTLVINDLMRKSRVLALLSDLHDKKIDAVVLKGFSISHLYHFPELRISGDTDIYIQSSDERVVLDYMYELGFDVSKRQKINHHSECYSEATGWVEIHTDLFDRRTQEIWFDNQGKDNQIQEQYHEVTDNCCSYKILGDTDNAIFLSLHMIKHFITEGINLRQMLDVSLFYFKKHCNIDQNRYWQLMKRLHYDSLIATLLTISIEFCMLPKEWISLVPACSSTDSKEILINDIERDKYQNSKEIEARLRSGDIYSEMIGRDRIGKHHYFLFIFHRNANIYTRLVLPKAEKLKKKYPILMTHKALIPFIWFYHVFIHAPIYLLKRNFSRNRSEEKITCASRLEMFKKLGMLR